MSIWLFMRISAVTAAGLAPRRSLRPHHCWNAASLARDGANRSTLPPVPQAVST
jgi:hypothetical protein